jgi:hypothetical protein
MTFLHLTLLATMALISCFAPTAEATLSIRVDPTNTVDYPSWDPFRGEASKYTIPGILLMGDVQSDCTIRVDPAAGPAGQAILQAVDSQHLVEDSILVLRYNWLDYCATYDDVSLQPYPLMSFIIHINYTFEGVHYRGMLYSLLLRRVLHGTTIVPFCRW